MSNDEGKVDVSWPIAKDRLIFVWQEKDGPPVEAPQRKGFGSVLIEQATSGHAELEFPAQGIKCTLTLPLK